MPIDKLVNPAKDLTTFTCYGDLSADEILLALTTFYQGVEDPPTRKALWNMANVSSLNITMNDMDEIVALRLKHEGIVQGGRTAIVALQDVNFGLARVFEFRTSGTDRDLVVFRTYEEAAEWIEK